MAAPTLQAEGALSNITTGNLAPVLPAHQANDILIACWGFWGPNSTSLPNVAAPSGWTEIAQFDAPALDGKIGYYWKRAASGSEADPTFTRPAGWDTGTDTSWGGRCYVIRGAITTDPPWDEADPTVVYSTANQPVDALTVLGTERLAIHFLVKCDDYVTAPTVNGWTAGTQVESATGTDHSQGSFRKDNVSADTGADASTVEAPAAGRYAFLGISFKPAALTAVGDTVQEIWNTLAVISDTVQKVWNVRSTLGDTNQFIYNVRGALGDTVQYVWNVRSAVGDTLQKVWNVRFLATKSVQLVHNIRAAIGDTSQYIWNVLSSVTAVGDTFQLVWNVRSIIGDTIQKVWNVRAVITDTLQNIWNVRSLTTKSVQLIHNVREIIGDTSQSIWNVLILGIRVGLLLSFSKKVFLEIQPSITKQLSLTSSLGKGLDLRGKVED